MPDVTGKSFDEAKALIEQAGFTVRRNGFPLANRVVNQSNRGLTPLGTDVQLFVQF